MSEVVRSMSRGERNIQSVSTSRVGGGFRMTRWIFVLMLVVGVYSWWISRDTYGYQPFVSSEPSAVIVAQHAFQKRETVFASPSWKALPETARAHPVPAVFATQFDAPDWVLRNLFGQHVLCVAPAQSEYENAIYLSKMSRIGVLIERSLRRSSNNSADNAGGLHLRYLAENELYYAVRGRMLIASPSRRALIHALTLSPDERIAEDAWDDSIWDVGGEDIRGTIRLAEDSRWGSYFAGIGFALRVTPDEAVLKLKMPCTNAFYAEYVPSLEGKGAGSLYAPEPGPIQFSADVGGTYGATFQLLAEVLDVSLDADEPWLVGLLERETDPTVALLLQNAGTAVARTWHGYLLSDIVPAHVTSTLVANNSDVVAEAIAAAPPERSGAFEATAILRDTDRNWLEIATAGGPGLTDVVTLDSSGRTVLATTSRVQAELNGWGGGAKTTRLDAQGNLYVLIDPGAVLTECEALVGELEEGFAILSAEAAERSSEIARWREQMRSIREIELIAEHLPETRTIQATITIR